MSAPQVPPRGLSRMLGAVGWAGLSNWGSQLVLFFGFFAVSFLLEPAEIGLVALADGAVAIIALLSTCGMRFLVPQRRALPQSELDTAFWVAMLGGTIASVFLLLLAVPLSLLFAEPRLQGIVWALALIPLLTGTSAVQEGLLVRNFSFRQLSARALLSNSLGAATAISLAANGAGVWSLVAQRLVTSASFAAMSWAASPWRPRWHWDARLAGLLARRGLTIVSNQAVVRFDGRTYEYVIGFFLGAASVGYFRFAWRCYEFLVRLVSQPVSDVMLPALSALRSDRERYRSTYLLMLGAGVFCAIPGFGLAWAFGDDAIHAVFGDKWAASVPILQVLCLAGVLQTLYNLLSTASIALSRAAMVLRLNLVLIVVSTLASVVAIGYGGTLFSATPTAGTLFSGALFTGTLFTGTTAIAWVHLVRELIGGALVLVVIHRLIKLGAGDFMRAIRPVLVASVIAAVCVFAYVELPGPSSFTEGVFAALAICLIYLLMGWLSLHNKKEVLGMFTAQAASRRT